MSTEIKIVEAVTAETVICYCDSCSRKVYAYETRYKCTDCTDFDYCPDCFTEVNTIHPGHLFETFDPKVPAPEGIVTKARPENTECPSCAPVTMSLPILHFVLGDLTNRRQAMAKQKKLQVRWPVKISQLIEATQRGCAFCAFMLHTFFRKFNGEYIGYDEETPWYADPLSHDKERMELVEHCMGTLSRLKKDSFDFRVTPISPPGGLLPDISKLRFDLADTPNSKEELNQARVFHSAGTITTEQLVATPSTDPASANITTRPPNPHPTSPSAIALANTWLTTCETSHKCRPPPTGPPPTRLIDLTSLPTLRIITASPSQPLQYAALTYCWGGPQPSSTTTSNLSTRQAGFPLSSLPQTLIDAITTTANLSIPYLWIDALCILQDNPEDKFLEIANMVNIFKHAFLTISASRADSADQGFLQDRRDPKSGLWRSAVPMGYYMPSPGVTRIDDAGERPIRGKVYLLGSTKGMNVSWKDPIKRRAWCLQEEVLSPRILGFGRWMTWRCRVCADGDGGYEREEGDWRGLTRAVMRGKADLFGTVAIMEMWRGLVGDYTERRASLQVDRLPAVGGIAREVSRVTGMEYVGGLWGGNMLQDLMWIANAKEWLTRPDEWRAPSWSWAAVEAPVQCDVVTADAVPLATAVGWHVIPVDGSTVYEMVGEGSSVEVRGPLGLLQRNNVLGLLRDQGMGPPPPVSEDVQEWYKLMLDHIEKTPKNNIEMEVVEEGLPERVFGLALFERPWRGDRWDKAVPHVKEKCWFGLLLKEVEEGKYERIGAFWNDSSEFLAQGVKSWEEQTVLLV
ncbi:hypothetical protein OQA88_5274 [Cercophora sp. LCS_1]